MTFAKEGIEELARSIEARGVIQPIVVRVINDSYELIVGERRLRAVESLGRTTIPAVIHEGASNEEAMELTLIENIQREDLNAIEEAQAYYRLMKDCNLSAPEVASKVGKDRSTVANAVRLLTLPEEIVKMIYAGQLSAGHARTLLAVPDDNEKIALAQKVSLGMLSVRELERAVYSERPDKRPKAPEKRVRIRPIEIIALEEKLKRTLGTKVQLKHKGRGGRIIVEYYSNDELDRLLAIFGVSMIRE
jgi:ParB family chromosome partitioning protein